MFKRLAGQRGGLTETAVTEFLKLHVGRKMMNRFVDL